MRILLHLVFSATPKSAPAPVKPRPKVDFAFLRQQVTMQQLLHHLGLQGHLRGRGQQRHGPCPVDAQAGDTPHTFSVHLGKNVFPCFDAKCAMQGNVLDLWSAVQRLPIYEAALHLVAAFQLRVNREVEPVQ